MAFVTGPGAPASLPTIIAVTVTAMGLEFIEGRDEDIPCDGLVTVAIGGVYGADGRAAEVGSVGIEIGRDDAVDYVVDFVWVPSKTYYATIAAVEKYE